jgi:hypothetical protein
MPQNLIDRLSSQLKATGAKDPEGMARALLTQRGQLGNDGKLTAEGKKREAMGAEGRAIDRQSKYTGKPKKDFVYSSKTNRATLKKGK